MRKLHHEHRLTVRSHPDVLRMVGDVLSDYGSSRVVLFRGRKLSQEALVNAAIMHVLGLPEPDRAIAIGTQLSRVERLLADDPLESAGGATPPGGRVAPAEETVSKPKARKKA